MKTGMAALAALFVVTGCASAPAPAPDVAVVAKGYVIAEIEVTNPEAYEGYKALVAPMIAEFGGTYLVRGGKAESREGAAPKGRIVVLEFPTFAAAQAFNASPEYAAIIQRRTDNAVSRVVVVEGLVR